jgi:quercetin dioxygenase-like cupin family protein
MFIEHIWQRGVLLPACVVAICPLAPATAGQVPTGAQVVSVIQQALADAPGESLTTEVVELAPGMVVTTSRHTGTVFAIVLSGAVRLRPGNGGSVDHYSGDSWTELPGTAGMRVENPSTNESSRLLNVFVAPTGATLAAHEP